MREGNGAAEVCVWGGGVFSLQLIPHHFPTPSISSPLSPLFYTICSYLSAFLNEFPTSSSQAPLRHFLLLCFQGSPLTRCSCSVGTGKLKVRGFAFKNQQCNNLGTSTLAAHQYNGPHGAQFDLSSTGVINNLNNLHSTSGPSFRALVLCALAYWHGLLGIYLQ